MYVHVRVCATIQLQWHSLRDGWLHHCSYLRPDRSFDSLSRWQVCYKLTLALALILILAIIMYMLRLFLCHRVVRLLSVIMLSVIFCAYGSVALRLRVRAVWVCVRA